MDHSIGDFTGIVGTGAHASIVFYPSDFPVRWSQCSATADFFAEYFASVHTCGRTTEADRAEFVGTLSYIVNELIENAVKFSVGETVEITVAVEHDQLIALVTNQILAATVDNLLEKLHSLLDGDPSELLFARVEANAENPETGASGLGFLTMMSDYGVQLGWHITSIADNPNNVQLETMARLQVRTP